MDTKRKLIFGVPALAIVGLLMAVGAGQAQVAPRVEQPAGTTRETSRAENNKKVAVAFYNAALNAKNPDEALRYVGPVYKQHNPTAEDGRAGLRKFIEWVRSDHPDSRSDIRQIFADGDYVIMNVQMVRFPGERGLAIGEIFRLEDGKIVEHWDRIQAIPENSKNNNGMF